MGDVIKFLEVSNTDHEVRKPEAHDDCITAPLPGIYR
jgi:hypothetical protein